MTGDREHFRTIPLQEYEWRRQKVDSRITQADLEDGLFAQAYSTNRFLTRRESAVNFTVRLEEVDKHRKAAFGVVSFKLLVYSGKAGLEPIEGFYRYAEAKPENIAQPRDGVPIVWEVVDGQPITTPQHHQIFQGFLTQWADDDLSDLGDLHATISDEKVMKRK